jgi:hypothetical protein
MVEANVEQADSPDSPLGLGARRPRKTEAGPCNDGG